MQRKTKKIILALVVIGVVAAGGAAFTAGNSLEPSVAGYGSAAVTGANATSIHHILSDDGTHIEGTELTLTGQLDDPAIVVQAGFDTEDLTTCGLTLDDPTDHTNAATGQVVCDWTGGADPLGHATGPNATSFHVAVSGTS